MARRGNRRTNSVGRMVGVGALAALIVAAVAMVAMGNRSGAAAGAASDVGGAMGRLISVPVAWVEGSVSSVGSFFGGSTLNGKLKAENASLLQWRDQARAMAERLDAYEKLHNIASEQIPQGLTGRLIGESAGTFSRAGIVNLGTKAGVQVNWIVLNQNGLVGRVIAVGADTSRVLLLGDGDSRVPVMGEVTRARAIVSGDKTQAPRLAHLNTPALMQDGERVMTSGDDGIFPRGIAVGQAGIAPDKLWHVRLASNASPIDFFRMIPPSNFPPPLEPVTPPPLTAPPAGALAAAPALGVVLPLAAGAASVPGAATPDAIRAAQTETARNAAKQTQANQALTKRLVAERDAARDVARKAEAARLLAERRAGSTSRNEQTAKAKSEAAAAARPARSSDPTSVPVAPSALATAPSEAKKAPSVVPAGEGPT